MTNLCLYERASRLTWFSKRFILLFTWKRTVLAALWGLASLDHQPPPPEAALTDYAGRRNLIATFTLELALVFNRYCIVLPCLLSISFADAQEPDLKSNVKSAAKKVSLAGPTTVAFERFSTRVKVSVDGEQLVVECDAMPEHGMMVGIRSWQQQVPLPQPFRGDNAWRLPLKPRPASQPISVLKEPLRGAIALAVNGVPIFCALNNRGDDTYLAGELDEWGGHCGRGDDYHYHIAPVQLERLVGVGNPIAFALDGYPILGYTEADGSSPTDLDEFNGHKDPDGHYHYHATKSFPYINGGLHGAVTLRGDQIDQPRDAPVRPGQRPLQGAVITDFERNGERFDLTYEVGGNEGHVKYAILGDNQFEFTYMLPSGKTSTVTYQRGHRGPSMMPYYVVAGVTLSLFLLAAFMKRKRRNPADPPLTST